MTDYIKEYRQRKLDNKLKDLGFFGIFGGTILILFGSIKWLISDVSFEKWYLVIAILGWAICISGLIIPDILGGLYRCFIAFGNFIGKIIFSYMLSFVYIILVVPIGLIMRKKRNNYDIAQWDGEYEGKENSGFAAWKNDLQKDEKNENSMRGIAFRLLGYFFTSGQYILMPSVFILIVIGVFLFFVSSSVIAPFIYTLF